MTNDPYSPIAEIYDFSYEGFDEDVEFYENLARAGNGTILELGVGSGRVAVPLSARGFKVTGIDTSTSMLAKAHERAAAARVRKGGDLELLAEDMTSFDLGRRFGLVLCAANTFQHMLTTEEQRACLQCAAKHLEPGGIFAMSIRSPASVDWAEAGLPAPLLLDWVRDDPATGDQVMKLVAAQPDPGRMTRRMTYVYDRVRPDGEVRRSVFVTDLRYSTQAELTLLLQQVGLRVTHVYGDYDLCPVGEGDNLVFVARAEGSR
jgi:SAM-dependent methyltransferase